jgi:hypothetical protein
MFVHRWLRPGEAGEAQHRLCGNAGERRHARGCEARDRLLDLLDPGGQAGETAGCDEALVEQRSYHPGEQRGVGAGPDGHVPVGPVGGPRAPGIDDDDASAAAPDPGEAPGPVGRGGEAAVRLERVRSQQQQEVRAVEVGDGDDQRVAEDEAARHVLRHLVDGRAEKTLRVPRSERAMARVREAGRFGFLM